MLGHNMADMPPGRGCLVEFEADSGSGVDSRPIKEWGRIRNLQALGTWVPMKRWAAMKKGRIGVAVRQDDLYCLKSFEALG